MLQGITPEKRLDAIISGMVVEAIRTSEIEGEYLSRKDVMSSIRRQFGLVQEGESVSDPRA
jgi:hypothetical protein